VKKTPPTWLLSTLIVLIKTGALILFIYAKVFYAS
jgi:hypothetical protein